MKMLTWAGAAALALAVGGTAQAETIKIGVVAPFSGANADLGQQIDKAFDLYIKLHAKDIAPHTVVMDRGHIVFDGPSATLRNDPARLEQLIGVVKA